jgi:hypothetical protein
MGLEAAIEPDGSIGGDAGFLDHLGPQRDVSLDDIGEGRRGALLASQPATSSRCCTSVVASAVSCAALKVRPDLPARCR